MAQTGLVDRSALTAVAPRAEAPAAGGSPWTALRENAGSLAPALAVCLAILIAVEVGVFRSGLFISQLRVSSPDFPEAKLALAQQTPDARVLYVGDSTVLTGVVPAEATARCACGAGFNGGFAASTPWLTRRMTERLLEYERPALVVIGVSPWDMEGGARFTDSEMARELFAPAELANAGIDVDRTAWIDKALDQLSSVYADRLLIKEWLTSLVPGGRYDASQRGYFAVPGSATAATQLSAEADRMKAIHPGEPSAQSAGATVVAALVSELRARGIAVAFLLPPLHPEAYAQNGAFITSGEAAVRQLAATVDVPVIDCRAAVSADDFRDLLHLRPSGAAAQSRCVGDALRSIG